VAVWLDAVVYCPKVGEGVVITWHDMIDGVSVRTSADVADELIPPKDDSPAGAPVFWKSRRPGTALPMNLMF
jgi:hypothetical protein